MGITTIHIVVFINFLYQKYLIPVLTHIFTCFQECNYFPKHPLPFSPNPVKNHPLSICCFLIFTFSLFKGFNNEISSDSFKTL